MATEMFIVAAQTGMRVKQMAPSILQPFSIKPLPFPENRK